MLDQHELVGVTKGEPAYAGVRVPYDGDVNRCAMLPTIPARMNDYLLGVRLSIVGPVCFSHQVSSPRRRPPVLYCDLHLGPFFGIDCHARGLYPRRRFNPTQLDRFPVRLIFWQRIIGIEGFEHPFDFGSADFFSALRFPATFSQIPHQLGNRRSAPMILLP